MKETQFILDTSSKKPETPPDSEEPGFMRSLLRLAKNSLRAVGIMKPDTIEVPKRASNEEPPATERPSSPTTDNLKAVREMNNRISHHRTGR
jgi:hypothetical protein